MEGDAQMQAWINAAGITQEDNPGHKEFWDEMSGKKLCPEKVRHARLEELGELAKHRVYDVVPESECWKTGKAPIG